MAYATPISPTSIPSGPLFIVDVGQDHWEEIDWQPAQQ